MRREGCIDICIDMRDLIQGTHGRQAHACRRTRTTHARTLARMHACSHARMLAQLCSDWVAAGWAGQGSFDDQTPAIPIHATII